MNSRTVSLGNGKMVEKLSNAMPEKIFDALIEAEWPAEEG
jgi:hypothetical protein